MEETANAMEFLSIVIFIYGLLLLIAPLAIWDNLARLRKELRKAEGEAIKRGIHLHQE